MADNPHTSVTKLTQREFPLLSIIAGAVPTLSAIVTAVLYFLFSGEIVIFAALLWLILILGCVLVAVIALLIGERLRWIPFTAFFYNIALASLFTYIVGRLIS